MLKRNFNLYVVLISLKVHNVFIKSCLALIEIFNKFFDTTFIVESLNYRIFALFSTHICKRNSKSLCKECHFSESLLQNVVIIYCCLFENKSVGLKVYSCSGNAFGSITNNLKRVTNFSSLVSLLIYFSVSCNLNFKPFRKRINDRSTNSVKSA